VRALKAQAALERGPVQRRPAHVLFGRWLADASAASASQDSFVLPLNLFDPAKPEQLRRLWALLRHHGAAVEHYVRRYALPRCLRLRTLRYRATGEELPAVCAAPVCCVYGYAAICCAICCAVTVPRAAADPDVLLPCCYSPSASRWASRGLQAPCCRSSWASACTRCECSTAARAC